MTPDPHTGQHVRRVVLPSGRAIEVVYYEPLTTATAAPTELHVCPVCERDLVYPVDWEEVSATHWKVVRRCPNCEWSQSGQCDQAAVDRFDEHLDVGTEILLRDLRRMERANMEEEIDRFCRALAADAILPEDFGP